MTRWILARLRRHSFFTLAELNLCIRALLEELNQKPFKQLPGNRRQAFEALDQPALRPLPKHPYRYVAIKTVKVNIDYHVQYEKHRYSMPHQYVGETLELHASESLVSLHFRGHQLAVHPRSHKPGTTTEPSHMPERHSKHQQWTPGRLKNWAKGLGPEVLCWVAAQLEQRQHPEQACRACLGLLSLSRVYPAQRFDAACGIANRKAMTRLKQIKSVLTSSRDQLDLAVEPPQDHDNIRGPKHFH